MGAHWRANLIVLMAITVLLVTEAPMQAFGDFPRPPVQTSLVQIRDGRLVNQGVTVILGGLNYKDRFSSLLYEKSGKSDWSIIDYDFAQMAFLGAKVIRVWFNWIYYEPAPGRLDSTRLLADIQKTVDAASKNGLYIIVVLYNKDVSEAGTKIAGNWLQASTTTSKTDVSSADFWLKDGDNATQQRGLFDQVWHTISTRFKLEPIILAYELINEPYNEYCDQLPIWAQTISEKDNHFPLKSLYDQVVNEIRENQDQHIVMLNYGWGQGSTTFPSVNRSSDPQIIYDIHLYYTGPENSKQSWDHTEKTLGPWRGKDQNGVSINYTYPDVATNHDRNALRTRLESVSRLSSEEGYVFYLGEFGFTENNVYNLDVVSALGDLGFYVGFAYFQYCPGLPHDSPAIIQPILAHPIGRSETEISGNAVEMPHIASIRLPSPFFWSRKYLV
jgi:hypothetical protein